MGAPLFHFMFIFFSIFSIRFLVNKKQQKAMNRVLQRLKSVAEGECPMDEITDWTMETDDVDKFLYHTEEGYSKKELKKWDGI